MTANDLEFWRINSVEQKCGLSKSEIYRRMREGENLFPPNYPYRGKAGPNPSKFWASIDVYAWQLAEIGVVPSPAPNWPSLSLIWISPETAAPAVGVCGCHGEPVAKPRDKMRKDGEFSPEAALWLSIIG